MSDGLNPGIGNEGFTSFHDAPHGLDRGGDEPGGRLKPKIGRAPDEVGLTKKPLPGKDSPIDPHQNDGRPDWQAR